MSTQYDISKQNKVRQLKDKADYDRETVHSILDSGITAEVGFVQDGQPVVVPMIYGRDGETIYLHGARKARVIKLLESTEQVCINVTLIDGLVLARSAFNSSLNYRSVTVFGSPALVEEHADKVHALRTVSEHLMPGRWDELREPLDREIKMTGVIALQIESASAKISAGLPDDEDDDYDIPIWAGVVPVTTTTSELVDDDRLIEGVEASDVPRSLQGKTY